MSSQPTPEEMTSEQRFALRLKELRDELDEVRSRIRNAYKGPSVSLEGHSLTRQSLDLLEQREATLTWDIQELLQDGPFGATIIKGRYDNNRFDSPAYIRSERGDSA